MPVNPFFPALSISPTPDFGDGLNTDDDGMISSPSESGYEMTRPRFGRQRREFAVNYGLLTGADKEALETFRDVTVPSGGIFDWSHPTSGEVIAVRFVKGKQPQFANMGQGDTDYWTCTFTLREV